ncbi:MAG: NYN domain-containing protein [Nanoarchaeota archaeon]|nr:NYN domain-containing protein [Nanoarchaeota archaeon]
MNNQRVAIFIDGSNLYHNLKRFGIKIKFEDIIKRIETKREIVDIFYYTALLDKSIDEKKYKDHKRFLDKIKKIPNFNIILCNLRKIVLQDGSVDFSIKGDDVYLATDLIKGSYENLYDIAIIVSGDADFIPAINLARKNGKKVINAFFPKSSSYQLRNCCDGSINLRKALNKK